MVRSYVVPMNQGVAGDMVGRGVELQPDLRLFGWGTSNIYDF
jgi:hypothetical protein